MKAVLCYSGGLDSTTLLYHLRKEKYEVYPLMVYYGQKHERELTAAQSICDAIGLHNASELLDLESLVKVMKGSSQTSDVPVPDGHYAEESMKVTVVPNRNMVLLSLATAWAVSLKAEVVAYAAHAGDHTIYPDCRPEFIATMAIAMGLCDWHKVGLMTPFSVYSKADIVKLGEGLGVPFEKTYSCYKGRKKHCGLCGTCTERKEAFKLAKVEDPTSYEA